MSANADKAFFSALSSLDATLIQLEEAGVQEVAHNGQQETAAYDAAIEDAQRGGLAFDSMISFVGQQKAFHDSVGTEPGFERALKVMDYDRLFKKLIAQGVLPNRPGYYQQYVTRIHKEGSAALYTGRLALIRRAREMVSQLITQLEDKRQVAASGTLIPSIDKNTIPAVLTVQRLFKLVNDELAADCAVYSLIAKAGRGTLGY